MRKPTAHTAIRQIKSVIYGTYRGNDLYNMLEKLFISFPDLLGPKNFSEGLFLFAFCCQQIHKQLVSDSISVVYAEENTLSKVQNTLLVINLLCASEAYLGELSPQTKTVDGLTSLDIPISSKKANDGTVLGIVVDAIAPCVFAAGDNSPYAWLRQAAHVQLEYAKTLGARFLLHDTLSTLFSRAIEACELLAKRQIAQNFSENAILYTSPLDELTLNDEEKPAGLTTYLRPYQHLLSNSEQSVWTVAADKHGKAMYTQEVYVYYPSAWFERMQTPITNLKQVTEVSQGIKAEEPKHVLRITVSTEPNQGVIDFFKQLATFTRKAKRKAKKTQKRKQATAEKDGIKYAELAGKFGIGLGNARSDPQPSPATQHSTKGLTHSS